MRLARDVVIWERRRPCGEMWSIHGMTRPLTRLVGHYTQMVRESTSRVGCGAALCKGDQFYIYCNYVGAQTNLHTPYQIGNSTCMACPDGSCVDNLCMCTKVSQNGGILGELTFYYLKGSMNLPIHWIIKLSQNMDLFLLLCNIFY